MTHAETGGIVAAPTTSLPEDFGGERNWDYRFCWLRDAALTLESLLGAGYAQEALHWRNWLLRAVAGDPEDLQIMYAVDGGRQLPERELPTCPGYADSPPGADRQRRRDQRQTDVLGEVMIALELARRAGLRRPATPGPAAGPVDELAEHWDEPDNGLWEIRGPQRHFTHSRVMVWAAFDRAVAGGRGPRARRARSSEWRELRDQVRDEILDKGFDAERGTFTQHYDTDRGRRLAAAHPAGRFLPGDDPRVLGTIEAVEQDLMRDGLLLRYRTETGVDGLSGDEHPFLACSFWLVSALRAGRPARRGAGRSWTGSCGLINDVGLLSEEYDPVHGRMVGNFPQAFSHLTFIGAAHALAGRSGPLGGGMPTRGIRWAGR